MMFRTRIISSITKTSTTYASVGVPLRLQILRQQVLQLPLLINRRLVRVDQSASAFLLLRMDIIMRFLPHLMSHILHLPGHLINRRTFRAFDEVTNSPGIEHLTFA
jgi:hypothetical protein